VRRAVVIIAIVYLVEGVWSLVGSITEYSDHGVASGIASAFAVLAIVLAIGLLYHRDWARLLVRSGNGMCLLGVALTIVLRLSAPALASQRAGAVAGHDWETLSGWLGIGAVTVLLIGIEYVMRHPATRALMGSPTSLRGLRLAMRRRQQAVRTRLHQSLRRLELL